MKTGWPRHRENREFGSYFFKTGKTQGILFWHREKIANTGKIFGLWLLLAATKLGQGNIFTGVCLSTGGRVVCLSACWDIPPGAETPPEQTPPGADPPEQTPPWSRSPRSRPPRADTPQTRPPRKQQTSAYSQGAASMHHTEMHSC